jgi:hypothetical protein
MKASKKVHYVCHNRNLIVQKKSTNKYPKCIFVVFIYRVESEESEDLHNKYKGMTADSDEKKKLKQIHNIRSPKRIQDIKYQH